LGADLTQLALTLSEPWLPANFSYVALNEDERRVYNALYFHQGSEAAVTVHELAFEAFPFRPASSRERNTRDLLKQLTEQRKIGIATSCEKPYGVFLICNAEELLTYTRNLNSRAMSMLRRAASLNKITLPVYLGQLSAALEEGEHNGTN
jgi:hypothetical protein